MWMKLRPCPAQAATIPNPITAAVTVSVDDTTPDEGLTLSTTSMLDAAVAASLPAAVFDATRLVLQAGVTIVCPSALEWNNYALPLLIYFRNGRSTSSLYITYSIRGMLSRGSTLSILGGSYAFYHLVRAFSYLEITESSTLEIVGVVGSSTPSEYLFGTFLLLTVGGLRVGEGSALRIENNTVSADQSPSYIYALCALVETQTSFTVLATVRTWSETTRSSWLTHPCPAISMRAW